MAQIMLSLLVIIGIVVVLFIFVKQRQKQTKEVEVMNFLTIEAWSDSLGDKLAAVAMVSEYELENNLVSQPRQLFANSYEDARNMVPKGIGVVKGAIRDIAENELNEQIIDKFLDFENLYIENTNYSFEALVYWLTEVKGIKNWFTYICKTYNIAVPKKIVDDSNRVTYQCIWTTEDLVDIIQKEIDRPITYAEKLDIVTAIGFMRTIGPHIVTEWYNADIDGFHYGTRGSIRYKIDGNFDEPDRDTNSLAVQKWAKWIQIPFLDFENIDTMKRVTDQLVSWSSGVDLSEQMPSKVTEGYDGSRTVAIIPPVAESYGCFVRKFSKGMYNKLAWFDNPRIHGQELPIKLTEFMMQAEITSAVTGPQNVGKTTLMKILIGDTQRCNIRALEMMFELGLREIYKDRDIFTCKETQFMSSEEIQDIFKKCDSYLSLVGEVATNKVAARMIQFCIIASAFTLFSHHALDDDALVGGLASSLVSSGEYENHDVATSSVLDAIRMNVHCNFVKGERVVEYISYIEKLPESIPYPQPEEYYKKAEGYMPKNAKPEAIASMANAELNHEYYTRRTDRVRFVSHKLMYFDSETMTYKVGEAFPTELLVMMMDRLPQERRSEFVTWYKTNWASKLQPKV